MLFDLDETLYPRSSGLMAAINNRIGLYMLERLGMEAPLVQRLRPEYFRRYGTTMRGLSIHYGIDCDDYLAFVHDLPVADYIGPDPELDAALARIPWRKSIFTNASRAHARRVLAALGVERHFGSIFDVATVGYESKPAPSAYAHVAADLAVRAGRVRPGGRFDAQPDARPGSWAWPRCWSTTGSRRRWRASTPWWHRAAQVADVLPDIAAGSRKWVCGPVTLTQRRLL